MGYSLMNTFQILINTYSALILLQASLTFQIKVLNYHRIIILKSIVKNAVDFEN